MIIALTKEEDQITIMWNWEKVNQSVRKLHWMIIAALKWLLLTIVFIGKDKTKCGKWKVLHTFWHNYLGLLAKQGMPLHPFKHGNVSLQMKFYISLFNTQIIFLSNLTLAAKWCQTHTTNWDKAFIGLLCLAGTLQSNGAWKKCGVLGEMALKIFT
jgi:hypothetical protein